jgi:hypothetical protein
VLFKKLSNPTVMRNLILRVLSQQDFDSKYFTIILSQAFTLLASPVHHPGVPRRELPVRHDLQFWLECARYIPRI